MSASLSCSWCGSAVEPSRLDCPSCGAAVDLTRSASKAGWSALPVRRDLVTLSFGTSTCQISGGLVPVADFDLSAEDQVYFSHHVLLWKDTSITVEAQSLKGVFKRLLAGMPLVMTQTKGAGRIGFSKDSPGQLLALPLRQGQAVDVREHLFLVADTAVKFDWFESKIWFRHKADKDDYETFYPVGSLMDRFSAPDKAGLLLLHASGNVQTRILEPGQTILVKPTALIFKDTSVSMELHFEHPAGLTGLNSRALWLKLRGPGRVAIQSVFEPLEGEHLSIYDHSAATSQYW